MACPFIDDVMDEEALILRRAFRRERFFRDRSDPLAFDDSHLYERYRFCGDGICYLCRLLGPKIQHRTSRSHALTIPQTVCIGLRFFASGIFLYAVGDAENLSKATVCRSIRQMYLVLKGFLNIFITFPGHKRTCFIKEEFYKIAGGPNMNYRLQNRVTFTVGHYSLFCVTGFPNVIGAMDCTHIRIKRPSGVHEGDFVNRKSYHSINVQMICDADCTFSNVEAKWPGSVHDSRVFRASTIFQRLSQGEYAGVLLGDKGYACQPFLLTPFADPQTAAQHTYNLAHARSRARIEMAFGLLKSRFQCLHHLRVTPERACDITVACTALHNIACLRKERAPRVALDMDWDNEAIFQDNVNGRLVRDQYVANYF
ncbi:putative nuclease HARBI1 [Perca fluviatilis]|uniref:putative nuclease HARBI1 n=1 Tax=Perca fluviatilis TaxID=8168 RepID=UPI0019661D94|nr:putative nuclease HARBI1 [Perca fluviatilis]